MKKLFVILLLVFASHVMSSCSDYFTGNAHKANTAQNDNYCCGDGDDEDTEDPYGDGN